MKSKFDIYDISPLVIALFCLFAAYLSIRVIKRDKELVKEYTVVKEAAPQVDFKIVEIALFDTDGNQVTEYVDTANNNKITKFKLTEFYFVLRNHEYLVSYGVPSTCQAIGARLNVDKDNEAITYTCGQLKAVLNYTPAEFHNLQDSLMGKYRTKVTSFKEKYGERVFKRMVVKYPL